MKNKTAILITCHKNPQQINKLTETLSHPDVDIFIHVDKKSNIQSDILTRDRVYIIPDEKRISVEWGRISIVDATLVLMTEAQKKGPYNYYISISGEDWPCKSVDDIIKLSVTEKNRVKFVNSLNTCGRFNKYDKRNSIFFPLKIIDNKLIYRILKRLYIEITGGYNKTYKLFTRKNTLDCKFYFGSAWWGLNRKTVEWMLDYLDKNPQYYNFYKNCSTPDESFFQTLFMLSPYADKNTKNLTYLSFLPGSSNPKYLTETDIEKAYDSDFYFMRKIDLNITPLSKLKY